MFKSKYSTVLTIMLIVLIIVIVVIAIIFGVKTYKNYVDEKDRKAYAQLDNPPIFDDDENDKKNEVEDENQNQTQINPISPMNPINNSTSNGTGNRTAPNLPKVKFYKDYPTIGNINIPKTGTSYPILLDTSTKALDLAVGVTYPSSPTLNKPGNVVIIGHNYRNGKFFSNNKNLELGDIIKISDLEGTTLTYKIYEIFETTPTDTAYMTKDRGENIEISLSTCTDDGNNRLVILARVEE